MKTTAAVIVAFLVAGCAAPKEATYGVNADPTGRVESQNVQFTWEF